MPRARRYGIFSTTAAKVFEAERALADGAHELDMVLNIGRLRSGRDDEVHAEIAALEDRRDKTRLLKEGMMQELLTGRTRLL